MDTKKMDIKKKSKCEKITIKDRIIKAFEDGMRKPSDIAKEYSLNINSVRWYISKMGLSKCNKK